MTDGDETAPGEEPPAPGEVLAFFLALAAKGKEAWNAWRRNPANKDVRVTFAGIDFSVAPNQINFQGFEFGDHANLSRCKWRGGNWEEIQKDPGNFTPGCANFTAATFGDEASFTGAVFGDCAKFTSVTFGERANFTAATFGNLASFVGAAFGDQADFAGAAFGELARFDDTVFKGRVEITGIPFDKWQAFKALLAVGRASTTEPISRAELSRGPPILPMRVFTLRRTSMPRPVPPESILAASILVLFPPAASCIGLPNPKCRFDCAVFEKSRRTQKTTISNATSISRNARPSAASICVNY